MDRQRKIKRRRWRTARNRCLLAGLLLIVAVNACGCGVRQKTIVFRDHLDENALELDGVDYPLRELAFYVAHEEQVIQEQALMYDPNDPNQYWNTHMNGHFMRVRARQEAMNQAIHDLIFYGMAQQVGMELDDGEVQYAQSKCDDFWMDLGEKGQQGLGITHEELDGALQRMALAQKYQELYVQMQDVPEDECEVDGAVYGKLLEEHSYKVKNSLWDSVDMGHVTVN